MPYKGTCPAVYSLMRFLLESWVLKSFLILLRYSFLIFFLLSPLVWWCPLTIFQVLVSFLLSKLCNFSFISPALMVSTYNNPSTYSFPSHQAFWFFFISAGLMVSAYNIPSTCNFPFLQAFCFFFLVLHIYFFRFLSFPTFHYKHGTFHSFILILYSDGLYQSFQVFFFSFSDNSFLSPWQTWLIFFWRFCKFVASSLLPKYVDMIDDIF